MATDGTPQIPDLPLLSDLTGKSGDDIVFVVRDKDDTSASPRGTDKRTTLQTVYDGIEVSVPIRESATVDGDGSSLVIELNIGDNAGSRDISGSRGFSELPNFWIAQPTTDDASGVAHTSVEKTGSGVVLLKIHYDTAPPSGTGNLKYNVFLVG